MAQLSGKYQLVENKNFYEFLVGVGLPEDKAKEANEIKGTLEVNVDGKKVTLTNDSPAYVTNLVVDEEVEEKMGGGDTVFKSTTSLNGNVLTISSVTESNPPGTRTFTFSDSGLEVSFNVPKDGKTFSASRIYKRI